MNQKTNKTIRTVYAYVLGASLLITAALFVYSAADIYFGAEKGGDIYTPAKVSAHFSHIAWLVYFTLVAIVGGGVICFVFPQSPEKLRAKTNATTTLSRLTARFDLSQSEALQALSNSRKPRAFLTIACSVTFSLCSVAAAALLVAAKTKGWRETGAAISVLPVAVVALAVGVIYAYANHAFLLREIDYLKTLLAQKAVEKHGFTHPKSAIDLSVKAITITRIACLCAGVFLVVFGAIDGGAYDTFVKAVQICTQCIGLG